MIFTPKVLNSKAQGRDSAPWVSVPTEMFLLKGLHTSVMDASGEYNPFRIRCFPGLPTQGAPLRDDPGLWSITPSA